ncbi:MAG TPA: hypothetical protein PK264_06525 [Hyphomicrobiaceae bacterium]|nr:hypothetical protein [Hyphomicrobiaceae bacterium]
MSLPANAGQTPDFNSSTVELRSVTRTVHSIQAHSPNDVIAHARVSGAEFAVTDKGVLALRDARGELTILDWTAPPAGSNAEIHAAIAVRVAERLNRTIAADWMSRPATGDGGHDAETSDAGGKAPTPPPGLETPFQTRHSTLEGLADETRRWGRDDIKRAEAGSAGAVLSTPVGAGLGHLVGLGDEDPGRRNGEKQSNEDGARFLGESVGVGSSIEHLWLLGDFDYVRSALELSENADFLEPPASPNRPQYGPLTGPNPPSLMIEDTSFSGRLFDPAMAGVPVVDRQITVDPRFGNAIFNIDGTFEFTPANGYSGPVTLEFSLTDPRTGRIETGIIEIMVQAVIDAPTITSGTTTLEDTTVATPVSIILNDPDGSEVIDQVIITGVPTGAVLSWDVRLPGLVSANPDGSLTLTGTTTEIQALLASLTLLPPDDFSGQITLNAAVVVTERNLDPAIPGYLSSITINHPIVIDVVADADIPDVTGDERTTDEDTPVQLPSLAAALNDLDGSEVLSIEVRNVPVGATFNVGQPDPVRPGVWLFTLAEIQAGPIFMPPANFIGDITMQIAATATEQANGDQEIVLDPIIVHVLPVDGPGVTVTPDITNEDTPVLIGDNITILIDDPLGSETLTSVEIRGFPIGSVITYTDTAGIPQTVAITVAGTGILIAGGTEAQIRTAVATVSVTPPQHSDGDLSIDVFATTTDIRGLTFTDQATLPVTVRAIIDAPTITSGATVLEDTTVGIPLTVALTDQDGSEIINAVTISGVPTGAVFGWSKTLPGLVAANPDGSYTVTGTTAEIQALLATLTLLPPDDYSGPITLNASVVINETNPDPGLPPGLATMTINHPIVIDVVADADIPDVTGDERTTNEDTPVQLPGLTAALNDLDGSEVLSIEIRNVPAGAMFNVGQPDPVRIGVWLFTLAEIQAGPIFTPPVNFIGDINMQIAAIATEQANSDQETVLDSVIVHVLPIDGPDVTVTPDSTNEDVPILIGDNIAITIADPLGSETLTSVEVRGFPVGSVISFTDTAGNPQTVTITVAGTGVTIAGGTEAQIRDAVATVSVKPPPHSDGDFALDVFATTTDIRGLTFTDQATLPVRVSAVADAPTVSGAGTGDEDTFIAVPITVTLVDADGSEVIDHVDISNIPAGATVQWTSAAGLVTTLPDGTLRITGSTAEIQARLASLEIRPPVDSDLNFDLAVLAEVREANPSEAGDVAVPIATRAFAAPVVVNPVADAPVITGTSSVNEDGTANPADPVTIVPVEFGRNIAITATDSSDGSERMTAIRIAGLPIGAVVSYVPVGGGALQTFTVAAGITTLDLNGGTEAEIRAALASLALIPPPHSDQDISLAITVTKSDATAIDTEPADVVQFVGTHVIAVAAVADQPTLTTNGIGAGGIGFGLEDANVALSLTAGHPDSDGTERLREVLIRDVPAGFILTESSPGAGILALDAGRNAWVVTGPTDAAVNDVLANLTLALSPAVGGPRQHLDTDFTLNVTVTSSELAPTNDATGGPEVALLDRSATFAVNIPVRAVADGVTPSGSSTLVEDRAATIGPDLTWAHIDADGTEAVTRIEVSGFPVGATVAWTPAVGGPQLVVVPTGGTTIVLTGADIRSALDTLAVTAPANSDANFSLTFDITTTDNDGSTIVDTHLHSVIVQAVADAPSALVADLSTSEDTPATLSINVGRSADDDAADNSETLSVRITVPSDVGGPVGVLTGTVPGGVTFTSLGGGVYTVTAVGADPATREALLDSFLVGGISFEPRAQWSGVLSGTSGIRVDVTSTEAAVGGELAPLGAEGAPNGTDGPTKTETVTRFIGIDVQPVVDAPTLANASTIIRENNNSSAITDPDLVLALGSRLGLATLDTDGSQGLSLTLTGLPTNLQAASFAATFPDVTTSINLATGTIIVSSTSAVRALAVIGSLSITLADDDDRNFTVAINGTMSDTNGVASASSPFSLTHDVIVRAVADTPTVTVGAATKPAVLEDSGFVGYPVTVALNDTDGSETFQSVRIDLSTPGGGTRPVAQFAVTAGVTFDSSVPGRTVLTGSAADIANAMASLEVRPGADNGEDITVTVTAIAAESNPAEDNNGATAGNGGGIAGPEISVPTAQTVRTFVIPVTPVVEAPTLNAPPTATGLEDMRNALAGISLSGIADPDGSEARFVEIDTTSFPAGSTFTSGGAPVGSIVSGWLRIPEASLAALEVQPPLHFTGTIALSIRATTVDTTGTDVVTTSLAPQTLTVTINPVADPAIVPADSLGFEDAVVAFGADLANVPTGIRVSDTVVGSPTNGGAETISAVALRVPADTSALTYTLSGTFVPSSAGTFAGSGTAEVNFNAATRTYTITSTIITGAADPATLTDAERSQAEADIRATLASFQVAMGQDRDGNLVDDGQQDRNGLIDVTVTTLDVKNGVADTETTSFGHDVVILARADAPAITAGFTASGNESGASTSIIPIVGASGERVVADRSIDTDGVGENSGWGSEVLSVRISGLPLGASIVPVTGYTLPAGASLVPSGSNFVVNAANEDDLNDVLANIGLVSPYYSGPATLTFTAITTEQGQAGEPVGGIDIAQATAVATVGITILPTVDTPIVKANASGLEDTIIAIPNAVTLGDPDGSESYVFRILATSVPAGAVIYGTGNVVIAEAGGYYTLTAAEAAGLAIRPPTNFSTINPATPDIVLVTETIVSDGPAGPVTFTNSIAVAVQGVADQPPAMPVTVSATEDEAYAIGAAIEATVLANTGGPLPSVLTDTDGSEVLSFVLAGLPPGVIPQASAGTISYLGGGRWNVSADAVPTLTLPPVSDYSGNNPYPGLTLTAASQELDSDQATSAVWPLTINVAPVIAAATIDGFSSWSPDQTLTETAVETAGVSLASASIHDFADLDGSERVLRYVFNLSTLIADAEIAGRLAELPGAGSGLEKLVANYISGTFAYYAAPTVLTVNGQPLAVAAGSIVVLPADLASIALHPDLFLDSNVGFSIPVSALLEDTAGGPQYLMSTGLDVTIDGIADVPTVFAANPDNDGNAVDVDTFTPLQFIPLSFGGVTTDIDDDRPGGPAGDGLGRTQSEDVYYILSLVGTSGGPAPFLALVDSTTGQPAGLNNGDGTFLVRPGELANLALVAADFSGPPVTMNFTVTTVAVDDASLATSAAPAAFSVIVDPGLGGTTGTPPPVPTVNLANLLGGTEDIVGALADPSQPVVTSDPSVQSTAVMFTVPVGATVAGAAWNPVTSRWVATAADFNAGLVTVQPTSREA